MERRNEAGEKDFDWVLPYRREGLIKEHQVELPARERRKGSLGQSRDTSGANVV